MPVCALGRLGRQATRDSRETESFVLASLYVYEYRHNGTRIMRCIKSVSIFFIYAIKEKEKRQYSDYVNFNYGLYTYTRTAARRG